MVSMLKFDHETRRLVRDGVPSEVNLFDVLAMSAVADLKETMSVEAVAFTMGPPQARDALIQCLAMGADRAVHLVDRAFAGSDTLATARALSLALGRERFDLIICGRNSVDAETAQVGPEIAEFLSLPQLTCVTHFEFDSSCSSVTAARQTDEGHEVVSCPLPALITVTEGVAPEVYPRPDALEAARSKPITELAAADLAEDLSLFGVRGSPTSVSSIYSIEPDRDGILVRDKPADEAVTLLMDYLEERDVFGNRHPSGAKAESRGPAREPGDSGGIWVVAELLGDGVRPVTLELLGGAGSLASQINSDVETVLMGEGVSCYASMLTAYGADRVHIADDPCLAQYDTELRTAVLADLIKSHSPYAVLVPSTTNGRDLAARVAARLGLGLTGDCIGLEIDSEGRLVQLKPAFGGNIVAPILSNTRPQVATVRPGILSLVEADWSVEPRVERHPVGRLDGSRVKVHERVVDSSAEGVTLEHAKAIVTVGKGVGSADNIAVVRQLAESLGASLGATRDVADLGWLPRQYQIGLSGKSVSPDLYIAVAVRGVFNHAVGIRKAGTVVAINNSARSPIFKAADFGILGDYAEVVPALTKAIKRRGISTGL